ncbi:DnaB helicase C-terminal domain-containing protein [Aliivibrio fischeri]|uniref:Replicative DNA helicase n=1 Tax=Aliivibrio fischeri SR5 TaxID=1088719 RepID=A0AAV3EQE7_ALIFS|nr:DnaB helicase C-terminal domain-containing protein [Aliivibrio fischeri]EHN68699.1 replicative DNA helicase [Aliivibrio fischeri SR5]OCH23954.1 hypothetical protein A6E12_18635 [Aliivibrio fischeri]
MKENIEVISMDVGLENCLLKIEKQYQKEEVTTAWRCDALSTGYNDVDKKTGGISKGLTVIAGRPLNHHAMFHRNIIENILLDLNNEECILHFESDLNIDSFYRRVVSSISRVDYSALESGKIDDESWSRISATMGILMEKQNLFIHGKSTYIEDIQDVIDTVELDGKRVSVISISSIHNLKTKDRYESRYAEVCAISKKLKAMAIDLNIYLIVGSNVNRKCEERADKRPLIWDLRDSGTLEEDANTIMFCYNNEVYGENNFGVAEVIIAKNDFGERSISKLFCNSQYSRFDNFLGVIG